MDKIKIEDITMPRVRSMETGGEEVVSEKTMAAGNLVRDIIGWRATVTASWEWVPQETLAKVTALARQCRYVTLAYPDPVEGNASGEFKIEIGNQKVFRFRNGEPYWYNVELKATAREVKRYAAGQPNL